MSTGPQPDQSGAMQLLTKGALPLVALLFVGGLTLTYVQLSRNHDILIERTAVQHAAVYSETLDKFRDLYASEVVETARKSNLRITHDYLTEPNAIPLPITLSRKFEAETPEGVTTRMYSPFPFKFPSLATKGGLKDDFARDAWAALNADPHTPFYRIEDLNGVRSLRYATSEQMKPNCVTCHNEYADSPKTDWREGDVRGVLEVDYPLDQAAALAQGSIWEMLGTLTPMLLLALLMLGLTTRNHRRHADALEKRIEAQRQAQRATAENADLRTHIDVQREELLKSRVELLSSEEQLAQVLESMPLGVIKIDPNGVTRYANEHAVELLGEAGVFGAWLDGTGGSDATDGTAGGWYWTGTDVATPLAELPSTRALHGKTAMAMNLEFRRGDRRIPLLVSGAPIFDAAGDVTFAIVAIQDISDEQRLDQQVRQAQRMEAVGRLAGGIAHDFNNELTTIFSFTKYAMEVVNEGPVFEDLEQVIRAAERGASLTKQLLAFSKQQSVNPQVLSLNETVTDIEQMLGRLWGDQVTVETTLGDVPNVRVGVGGLDQVLVNLSFNARDAMPDGGILSISTSTMVLDDAHTRRHGLEIPPGRYVRLSVADNGSGMDEATRRHMFDPFFTTKGSTTGTGLGLATCWGIVKQAGGHITVDSKLGHGTTIHVYLPATNDAPAEETSSRRAPTSPEEATVMVVEDDDSQRSSATRRLLRDGYQVLEAARGADALEVFRTMAPGTIDLLVTDVKMPGMSGPELVREVMKLHPDIRVLYISGYTDETVLERDGRGAVELLQKPFEPDSLARKVLEVLDFQDEARPGA